MSSTAPQLRSRLPRIAPRMAEVAVQRARLTVVPVRRSRAPKVPFVTLVSMMLVIGVIGLLLFNTSMQQASFAESALSRQATHLSAKEQTLQMELERMRDPQLVAEEAQRLGMVIPQGGAGTLLLPSGKVMGKPVPAEAGVPLPLKPPPPAPPAPLLVGGPVETPGTAVGERGERGERGGRGAAAATDSAALREQGQRDRDR